MAMAQLPVTDLLECTICLDVPASPIHNCSNGHVICGICRDKVKKCGLCQSTKLRVSKLAERLSRQLDFKSKCPYGCKDKIASAEIKDHIQKCYRRNATCNESKRKICKNVSIPLRDFPQHLISVHGAGQSTQPLIVPRHVKIVNKRTRESSWPMRITVQNSQTFMLHSCVKKGVFFFWMTVFGNKEEALKYTYEMTLDSTQNKKMAGGKNVKICWTLPVLPYHDYPEFKEGVPQFISIPTENLIEFSDKRVVGETIKYNFVTSHRIL